MFLKIIQIWFPLIKLQHFSQKSFRSNYSNLSGLFESFNRRNSKYCNYCYKFNLASNSCFLFLFDRDSIISGFLSILPKERAMLQNVWVEMDDQLSNYARGKAIEIVIVGLAAAIVFMYFDLQYIALLSVLVGFSVLIPFLGAFIVTLPVAALGLLQFGLSFDFWLLMGAYLVLQILDGYLLVPLLFSDAVKLHPVVIMLAVFVFGAIFGFWGVFFAIPIATLIKAIWNSWPENLSN